MDIPYMNCNCLLCLEARPGRAPNYCSWCAERTARPGNEHCGAICAALARAGRGSTWRVRREPKAPARP